jgi:hypothetical protein
VWIVDSIVAGVVGRLLGSVIEESEGLLVPVVIGAAAFVSSVTLMAVSGTRWFHRQTSDRRAISGVRTRPLDRRRSVGEA